MTRSPREILAARLLRVEIWQSDGGDPDSMLADLMNAVDEFLDATEPKDKR